MIRDGEVGVPVPVHIAQRHGNRPGSCGEGLLVTKRAVPVPQQHAHAKHSHAVGAFVKGAAAARKSRDGEVGSPIPVHIAHRRGKRIVSRAEGQLVTKRAVPVPQ